MTCVSTTFCVAAGASGYATKYNGTSWSTATDADSNRTIKTVSCPTSSLCVAVDTSGYATTYNGTSWATPTDIDGSAALEALSCVSSTSCDATDNAGDVLTYNGSAWSTPTEIDAVRSVNTVSCVSASFCVVGDGSGYAAVYHPLSTTAVNQLIWDTNGSVSQVLSDSTNDYIYGPTGEPVEQVNLSNSTPTYLTYTASDSSWLPPTMPDKNWRFGATTPSATWPSAPGLTVRVFRGVHRCLDGIGQRPSTVLRIPDRGFHDEGPCIRLDRSGLCVRWRRPGKRFRPLRIVRQSVQCRLRRRRISLFDAQPQIRPGRCCQCQCQHRAGCQLRAE